MCEVSNVFVIYVRLAKTSPNRNSSFKKLSAIGHLLLGFVDLCLGLDPNELEFIDCKSQLLFFFFPLSIKNAYLASFYRENLISFNCYQCAVCLFPFVLLPFLLM